MRLNLWDTQRGDVKFDAALVNNLDDAVDPTVSNDSTQGYAKGSFWLNVTGSKAWYCVDPTAGAAVWILAGSIGGATVSAGASGTAGKVDIFPATAAKGKTEFTAANNTGNTTTTINTAAQAGARTYTVPDAGGNANFMMSPETEAANGLFAQPVPFAAFRNADGTALAAAAAAGKFGQTVTLGSANRLISESANNNTKTDDAIFEAVLPPWYVAGQNVTVTVNASITGSGTLSTKTAQVKAYRCATDGTMGSDIGPGSASAITAAGADIAFTITGTTLNPGDRVLCELETILTETASSGMVANINSVRIS